MLNFKDDRQFNELRLYQVLKKKEKSWYDQCRRKDLDN